MSRNLLQTPCGSEYAWLSLNHASMKMKLFHLVVQVAGQLDTVCVYGIAASRISAGTTNARRHDWIESRRRKNGESAVFYSGLTLWGLVLCGSTL